MGSASLESVGGRERVRRPHQPRPRRCVRHGDGGSRVGYARRGGSPPRGLHRRLRCHRVGGRSAGQTYLTHVSLHPWRRPRPDGSRAALAERLHLPVAGDCKHAVAVVAAVRERSRSWTLAGRDPRQPPTWERPSEGSSTRRTPARTPPWGCSSRPPPEGPGGPGDGPAHEQLSGPSSRAPVAAGSAPAPRGRPSPAGTTVRRGAVHRDHRDAYRPGRRPPPVCAGVRLRADAGRDPPRPPRPPLGRLLAPPTGRGAALTDLPGRGEVAFAPDPPSSSSRSSTDDGAELHPRLDLPTGLGRHHRPRGAAGHGLLAARRRHPRARGPRQRPLDGTRQRLLDLGVVEVPEADWARSRSPTSRDCVGRRGCAAFRGPPAGCRAARRWR